VLEQIIKDGEVTRGWLGIEPLDAPAEVSRTIAGDGGVPIRGVVRGGPADRAGVHPQDVVIEIDGKPTRDTPTLLARIAELPPGNVVKIKILRDREARDLDVTVGKRPRAQ
jgi:serine protease DegQ